MATNSDTSRATPPAKTIPAFTDGARGITGIHPPANVLAFAKSLRTAFGPGVRLLYWRDDKTGQSQGRAENDFPANPDAITGDNG